MTYNVHRCVGTDGRNSPSRIASVISACNPDVVALQELDAGVSRSARADQAQTIARYLDMTYHFYPSLQVESGFYGNAILSRYPISVIKGGALPTPAGAGLEPRGAIWVQLALPGKNLNIINTHLGLRRRERLAQADALVGSDWLAHPLAHGPFVLCGDLNSVPGYTAHRVLKEALRDVQRGKRSLKTWPAQYPLLCIDHIFISPTIVVRDVTTFRTPLAKVASDHVPLLAELVIQ